MSLMQETQINQEIDDAAIIKAAIIVSISDQGDFQQFNVHDVRKQLLLDLNRRTTSDKRSCNPSGQKIVSVLLNHPELFEPNYIMKSNSPRRIRNFTRMENQEP